MATKDKLVKNVIKGCMRWNDYTSIHIINLYDNDHQVCFGGDINNFLYPEKYGIEIINYQKKIMDSKVINYYENGNGSLYLVIEMEE